MKLIIPLMVLISACTAVSQQPSEEMKKEAEFQEILRKADSVRAANKAAIEAADKKTGEIITKTTEQIVTLKQEVKQLKQEINETSIKPNSGSKFKFLPITNDSKDKQ
jgi:PDZ domain-containing secreted protein